MPKASHAHAGGLYDYLLENFIPIDSVLPARTYVQSHRLFGVYNVYAEYDSAIPNPSSDRMFTLSLISLPISLRISHNLQQ
jgi:hypothetical protein